jgi:hypothetical protein
VSQPIIGKIPLPLALGRCAIFIINSNLLEIIRFNGVCGQEKSQNIKKKVKIEGFCRIGEW